MRSGISISVSAADRRRLETIVADRNTPQKHVWRARIVLLTADGLGTNGIMAATGRSKTTVWRWQERFMEAGVGGLLQDKTRPPGKAPIAAARVGEVVRRTLAPPPHEATHWTARALAKACGLAVSTIQNIWKGAWPRAASVAALQALHRPGLRGEAPRHRRALRRPAGACGGAERRREVANSSA